MKSRRLILHPLLLVLGPLLCVPSVMAQTPGPVLTITLDIAVARCEGKPVKPASWIEAQLTAANAVFRPHGVVLLARPRSFTPARCDLTTRAQRHAMARHVARRGATVLVLRKIRDLDVRSYNLTGVHWRYRGKVKKYRGRRWVMLTARAIRPILAHEQAHFFGLRHDPAGGNLMTPGPSSPLWRRKGARRPKPFSPVLTVEQGRKLRRAVKRYLDEKKP